MHVQGQRSWNGHISILVYSSGIYIDTEMLVSTSYMTIYGIGQGHTG